MISKTHRVAQNPCGRNLGQGEVGGYHPLGDTVAAGYRKALVSAGWAIFLLSRTSEPRGSISGSVQSGEVLYGQRALTIECPVMNGCGQGHELAKNI